MRRLHPEPFLFYDVERIKKQALEKCNGCVYRRICSLYHVEEDETKKPGYKDKRSFGAMLECRVYEKDLSKAKGETGLSSWGIS